MAARHLQRFSYDTTVYDFRSAIADLYEVKTLENLHKQLSSSTCLVDSDSSSILHKIFYSSFQNRLQVIYLEFLSKIIKSILNENFFYQRLPCIRIGLPGCKWLDRYHTDKEYNHPINELNINLPILIPSPSTSLRIESYPGSGEFVYLDHSYGQFSFIDHINCLHGCEINNTQELFISLDFRLVLEKHSSFAFNHLTSVNTKVPMKPGGYFSSYAI